GERVELPRGEHEQGGGEHHEPADERRREEAGGQRARRGARVARVDRTVGEAVERHRSRARADHRDDDPEHRAPRWPAARSEEHAEEGEGEGEQGVLELDHLEHGARVANRREGRGAPAVGRGRHRAITARPRGGRRHARSIAGGYAPSVTGPLRRAAGSATNRSRYTSVLARSTRPMDHPSGRYSRVTRCSPGGTSTP